MNKKLELSVAEAIDLYYSLSSGPSLTKEKLRTFLMKHGVDLKKD